MATQAETLDKDAFMRLVTEERLQVEGPVQGYLYTGRQGRNGWELYRCDADVVGEDIDNATEVTAVTSNPVAGVISVDVKTFTGRGRVTSVTCSCVADATVATRGLIVQKISGTNTVEMARSQDFTASGVGIILANLGFADNQRATNYPALAQVDFGPGDILRVVVTGGQAGDNMSAITYSYKEVV